MSAAPSNVWEELAPPGDGATLIDALLREQQTLTAVQRFAQKQRDTIGHAQARYYHDLIPLAAPAPGEQYAFSVDLDKCSGCKACVSACHSLNGLEEEETWRDVGLVVGKRDEKSYQQIVTTACHHCAEPACLHGCPVAAYEKMESGIVRHLDDQCIGCQYCTMKCPYQVPKYSARLGIVRKCDMCHDRLSVGEAPACVQACPHQAIAINIVSEMEMRREASQAGAQLMPGTVDSSYTIPATRYVTTQVGDVVARPADAGKLRLEHAHWPLIGMLLLSQMSAGIFVVAALLGASSPGSMSSSAFPLATAAFAILNAGLSVSILHLGRPLGAWRFFLGLRTSWMSREILAFSVFAGVASGACGASWLYPGSGLDTLAMAASGLVGLIAVFTSVMIYVDTRRPYWTLAAASRRFYGATLSLGFAGAGAVLAWIARNQDDASWGAIALCVSASLAIRLGLTWCEGESERAAWWQDESPTHDSALTIRKLLPWVAHLRDILLMAIVLSWLLVITTTGVATLLGASLLLTSVFAAEVTERFVFFSAVVAYRMPGNP